MTFTIIGRIDDHVLVASSETAKEAFAVAVGWEARKLVGVMIRDGSQVYSLQEFATMTALSEIASTSSGALSKS